MSSSYMRTKAGGYVDRTREPYSNMSEDEINQYIYDQRNAALFQGGAAFTGLVTPLVADIVGRPMYEDTFDIYDRAEFAEKIKGLDPKLSKSYVRNRNSLNPGTSIPYEGTEYIPPDTSQRGLYKRALTTNPELESIATVTPTAKSSRFGASTNRKTGGNVGAQGSDTLWGHRKEPVFSYADNNYAVGVENTPDPSVHFSAAELKPNEKGPYLYTGGANEAAARGTRPTWGVEDSTGNIMYGAESRKAGGLTTAADLYEFARELGMDPPNKGAMSNSQYLQQLTEDLANKTGKTNFEVLEDLASPHPVSGDPGRATGQIPSIDTYKIKGSTPSQQAKFGWGSLLEENTDPFTRGYVHLPARTDTHVQLTKQALNPPTSGFRSALKNKFAGLTGAAVMSPEAAKLLREARFGEAALSIGAGFAGGELINKITEGAIREATKKGAVALPGLVNTAGSAISIPTAGISALDTATTLGTGKNARELLVDADNTQAATVAMSAPMSIAPLGIAGGPIQGNIPESLQTGLEESKAGDQRIQEARERGGKWKIGSFAFPEFGFSEGLEIN